MSNLVELVKPLYEEEGALFERLSENVEWHETEGLPYGGVYRGKEAIMQGVFSHVGAQWDEFDATPEEIVAVGETSVLSMGRYSGVHKDTRKKLSAAFAHYYTFDGDCIVKFQQFGDSARFLEAMQS